ncbi:hypothetical protein EV121DRAFT_282723 [Schizophyllum commune]
MPKKGDAPPLTASCDVHITIANSSIAFQPVAAAVIVTTTTPVYVVGIVKHIPSGIQASDPTFPAVDSKEFDMLEHRGDNVIELGSIRLVLDRYGPLCRKIPLLLKVAVSALTCNAVLNSIAKVANIFQGLVTKKDAADFLEMLFGKIDRDVGQAQAWALVVEVFRPLVPAAVLTCLDVMVYVERPLCSEPIFPSTTTSITFAYRKIPLEDKTDDYLHLISPAEAALDQAPSSSMLSPFSSSSPSPLSSSPAPSPSATSSSPLSSSSPSSGALVRATTGDYQPQDSELQGSKRRRDEDVDEVDDDDEEDLVEVEGMLLLFPPSKKRRIEGRRSSGKGAKRGSRKNRGQQACAAVQPPDELYGHALRVHTLHTAFLSLPPGSIGFDLKHMGPSLHGPAIDEFQGRHLIHYVLIAALTDIWADKGITSCAAAEAVGAMLSAKVVDHIARTVSMVDDAVASLHVCFFRAVARASREYPLDVVRQVILAIYQPVISVAIADVRPLYTCFVPHSLDHRRTHLRNVLRLRAAGYVYQSNLTPMSAVLTTNVYTIGHMFHKSFLRSIGVL